MDVRRYRIYHDKNRHGAWSWRQSQYKTRIGEKLSITSDFFAD